MLISYTPLTFVPYGTQITYHDKPVVLLQNLYRGKSIYNVLINDNNDIMLVPVRDVFDIECEYIPFVKIMLDKETDHSAFYTNHKYIIKLCDDTALWIMRNKCFKNVVSFSLPQMPMPKHILVKLNHYTNSIEHIKVEASEATEASNEMNENEKISYR